MINLEYLYGSKMILFNEKFKFGDIISLIQPSFKNAFLIEIKKEFLIPF